MNTKQTIALWYSGLFLILAFLYLQIRHEHLYGETQVPLSLAVIVSIVILASLLIYSLGDSTEIDSSTLFRAVGVPILLMVLIFVGMVIYNSFKYNANPADEYNVSPEDIRLLDPSLNFSRSGGEAVLSGRIQNNSDITVRRMELRIRIYSVEPSSDSSSDSPEIRIGPPSGSPWGWGLLDSLSSSSRETAKLLDGETVTWSYSEGIPSREVESFSLQEDTSVELPSEWAWSYEVISAQKATFRR